MKTNFFENIGSLHTPGNWKIAIHADEQGQFTVSALFTALHHAGGATNGIPPMLLKGTASEMDEGFFETITAPVQQTAGLYNNINAYHKELEKSRVASKAEHDKKSRNNPAAKAQAKDCSSQDNIALGTAKPNKEEMVKAYANAMSQIAELNGLCRYEEALVLLPSPDDYPEKEAELSAKRAELTKKKEQMAQVLTLFNA